LKTFPAADLGSGVHIALGSGGTKPMQATEAYVEGEQNLEVHIRLKGTREMQDVLSRCRRSFYRAAY
jgi:hypothetical protein